MRVMNAVLAVSLAANAAWTLTWALSKPSQAAPEERSEEAASERRAPDAAGVTLAASPAQANANKVGAKPVALPWDLASPPPALGEREGPKRGAYVPLTMEPAGRLAARLGRAATSEESAVLTTMLGDFAANAADRLAREVAARRGRDEFVAHGGGPLLQRLPKRNDKKPTDEALVEILDFVAGRDF